MFCVLPIWRMVPTSVSELTEAVLDQTPVIAHWSARKTATSPPPAISSSAAIGSKPSEPRTSSPAAVPSCSLRPRRPVRQAALPAISAAPVATKPAAHVKVSPPTTTTARRGARMYSAPRQAGMYSAPQRASAASWQAAAPPGCSLHLKRQPQRQRMLSQPPIFSIGVRQRGQRRSPSVRISASLSVVAVAEGTAELRGTPRHRHGHHVDERSSPPATITVTSAVSLGQQAATSAASSWRLHNGQPGHRPSPCVVATCWPMHGRQ
mmetsp:Transcript_11309/g.22953  ORF Transcript_11309/g.22953 Transcript_11309/m.22953 type:complete len:265 (-) Transcript_11309:255-1049(-)